MTSPYRNFFSLGVFAALGLFFIPNASALSPGFPDCNGNGVDDAVDVSSGASSDCQADGIPDECQIDNPVSYRYDSGSLIPVSNGSRSVLLLNRYLLTGSFPFIGGVSYEGLSLPEGTVLNAGLWSDPNQDGRPGDCVLLASATGSVVSGGTGRLSFDTGVDLGADGTSFFIGIWFDDVDDWSIGFDPGSLARQGWVYATSGQAIDPNDAGPFDNAGVLCSGCNGDLALRALGCTQASCVTDVDVDGNGIPDSCEPDCNGNQLPDGYEVAIGLATDCDASGVLDVCEILDDCDQDGVLDVCAILPGSGLIADVWEDTREFEGGIDRTTIVTQVSFDSAEGGILIPGLLENYSVEMVGGLTPVATGPTRLFYSADDRLDVYIDNRRIDNNGNEPLDFVAGRSVGLRMRFAQGSGGARIDIEWELPDGTRQEIPASAYSIGIDRDGNGNLDLCEYGDCNQNGISDDVDLAMGASDCNGDAIPDRCQGELDCDRDGILDVCFDPSAVEGVAASYYESEEAGEFTRLVVARVEPNIDFQWGGGSPDPAVPDNEFAARFTGTLVPPVSGDYRIRCTADDGVRLDLDGERVIDEWQDQSGTGFNIPRTFVAEVPVKLQLEYYESGGEARCNFEWRLPGETSFVPVPSSALRPIVDLDGDGVSDACASDCDGDGVADSIAIASDLAEDCNGNLVPDACELGWQGDAVLAWWRFDDPSNLGLDSGPNGLELTGANVVGTSEVPDAVVPRTGQADLGSARGVINGRLVTEDLGEVLSLIGEAFTAEAFVKLDRLAEAPLEPVDRQWLLMRKNQTSDGRIEWAFLVQLGDIDLVSDIGVFGNRGPYTGRELAFVGGIGSAAGRDKWVVVSNLSIDDNEWHHVSVASDPIRSEVRFELDGVVDHILFSNPPTNPNSHDFVVGGHSAESGGWNQGLRGVYDEIRIRRGIAPLDEMLDVTYATTSEDVDGDGVPDDCDADDCPADFNGDGIVSGADFGSLLAKWGECPGCPEDLTGDGFVTGADIGGILASWGLCP